MPIAIVILSIVLVIIAFRRVTKIVIPIWTIMALGAAASIFFRQITPIKALTAIEPDVILYLFGVFLISQAAEESGYLEYLTDKLFFHTRNGRDALLIIVFVLGLSSAFIMNDTVAIVGTPIILQLCKSHKHLTKPLLFALAFSVTIGSAMSPIGNPQNLLIVVKSGMVSPFFDFIKPLVIPTMINLIVTYLFIYLIYRKLLNERLEKPAPSPINHYQTVVLVKVSLIIMFLLIVAKIATDFIQSPVRINFGYIALISALPIFLSKKRWILLKNLDWGTLIFFASTFVLMQSVWDSGFFQASINKYHLAVTQIPIILIISVILSQFISNVPLVALYLPLLTHHGASNSQYLALAVGSTIAGNLSILGAASNVIIVQNVDKHRIAGFGFFEFIKLGAPLILINILIYVSFL